MKLSKQYKERSINKQKLSIADLMQGITYGSPQVVDYMQIIPLFRDDFEGFARPNQAYIHAADLGTIVIENTSEKTLIVPSHAAFMVKQAVQNQAMSHAAIIAAGNTNSYNTAICIQEFQEGLIEKGQYELNFIPFSMRECTLASRYDYDSMKLYWAFIQLNSKFRLRKAARLEYFMNEFRRDFDKFVAQFECLSGQIGAIILLEGSVVGIEICPSAAYWKSIWEALIRECYGSLVIEYRFEMRYRPSVPEMRIPFDKQANSLEEIEKELDFLDLLQNIQVQDLVENLNASNFFRVVENKYSEENFTLETLNNHQFIGQAVYDGEGNTPYVSLICRYDWYMNKILGAYPSHIEVVQSYPNGKYICYSCGFEHLENPPFFYGVPSYEKCPCCGFVYDVSIYTHFVEWAIRYHRRQWVNNLFLRHKPHPKHSKYWSHKIMLKQMRNTEKIQGNTLLANKHTEGIWRPDYEEISRMVEQLANRSS